MSADDLTTPEVWKPISADPDYVISDRGRIGSWKSGVFRLRAPQRLPKRYLFVQLMIGGVRHQYYIHRLVLEAFVGPCPEGQECRHLDGDRANNRLSNLTWGTPKENQGDRIKHGTLKPWTPSPRDDSIIFSDPFVPAACLSDDEIWADIRDSDGYQASHLGRVRSRLGSNRAKVKIDGWTILQPCVFNKYGHCSMGIRYRGRMVRRSVHRLIIEAFKGPPPPGMECIHIDGNPGNNRVDNLRWGTHRENMRARSLHGTDNSGERCGSSKLTEESAGRILASYGEGRRVGELAVDFCVSPSTIDSLLKGRTWKHIPR